MTHRASRESVPGKIAPADATFGNLEVPGVPMKFSCERCQTRYSIGDEKVKGKVLKIRCKTCGNTIVVREQEVVAAASAAVAAVAGGGGGSSPSPLPAEPSPSSPSSSSSSAPAGGIDWYMAVKGKQHGPAKYDEVVRLYQDGKITERTHLWHDKMSAWTRLKELPEFAAVVANGPAPQRLATMPPPPLPSETSGAEILNFEAARAQRSGAPLLGGPGGGLGSPGSGAGQPAVPPMTNDPFAAIQGVAGGGANDAPRESTRVFIMQAGLHDRAKKQRMVAGIAALGFFGFIGLCVADYHLDILGLKNVVEVVAERTGFIEEPIKNDWDDVEADPVLKCQLNPNPAECVKRETAAQAERRARRGGKKPALLAGGGVSEDDLKKGFENGVGGEADVVRRIGEGAGGIDIAAPQMSNDQIKAMFSSGKGGPTGPKARVDAPSVAGTSIDAENASKVVREGQPAIQTCVESSMKLGEDIPPKAHVTLSIQTNGTVEKALVNEAVINASRLGACITSTAKKWKFAPTPEAADLVIPLVLK
jgi:predicted Zn finger-like uncharacterized protein